MKTMLAAAVIAALSLPALAQTLPTPVLRFGVGAQVTAADPHYHNIGPNNAFASMVYDHLIEMTPNGRQMPMLATGWTAVAPDVWELRLRDDVTYHNGARVTADDVAAAFRHVGRVVNSPGSYQTYLNTIASVEIVSPTILRLHTNGPAPLLPSDLTQVPITGRMNETATTDEFNAGTAAIGNQVVPSGAADGEFTPQAAAATIYPAGVAMQVATGAGSSGLSQWPDIIYRVGNQGV